MANEQEQQMIQVAKTGGQTRWLAISALFLTIGVILRLVTPNIAGVTPNWLIAMYCLSILIVKPNIKQAIGIGVVAGVVSVATSKAMFPWANLASEPLGALVCVLISRVPMKIPAVKIIMPAVTTLFSTLASGMAFITITKIVMHVPIQIYVFAMIPVVLTVAAVNCVISQILYFPAKRLFQSAPEQEKPE